MGLCVYLSALFHTGSLTACVENPAKELIFYFFFFLYRCRCFRKMWAKRLLQGSLILAFILVSFSRKPIFSIKDWEVLGCFADSEVCAVENSLPIIITVQSHFKVTSYYLVNKEQRTRTFVLVFVSQSERNPEFRALWLFQEQQVHMWFSHIAAIKLWYCAFLRALLSVWYLKHQN